MDTGNDLQYGYHIPALPLIRNFQDLEHLQLRDHSFVAAFQSQDVSQRDIRLRDLHIPLSFDIDRFLISRHDILHPAF